MSKKFNEKVEKLTGNQLVETVKDTIYEVLEEELDARIVAAKKLKEQQSKKGKAERVKKLQEAKKETTKKLTALEKLQEKKLQLKKAYEKLSLMEKKLTETTAPTTPTTGTTTKKAASEEVSEEASEETLEEKWEKDVEVKKTGEHAGKTAEQIRKRLNQLKAKEDKSEAEKKEQDQLVFALRAKTGWKKGKGATKK